MKTSLYLTAALASIVTLPLHAQNLFSAGRPAYTRAPAPGTAAPSPTYAPSTTQQYAARVGRTSTPWSAPQANDYQRLQRAWAAYYAEAVRYQQRYSARMAPPNVSAPAVSSNPPPCPHCAPRTSTAPADYAPSLNGTATPWKSDTIYPRNDVPPPTPNPSTTTTNPVTDLFRSTFALN